MVRDTDGSAFITKAEFDSLKNNFQAQIDNYNSSIDSKIDGAIASYLAGIKLSSIVEQPTLFGQYISNKYFYSDDDPGYIKFLKRNDTIKNTRDWCPISFDYTMIRTELSSGLSNNTAQAWIWRTQPDLSTKMSQRYVIDDNTYLCYSTGYETILQCYCGGSRNGTGAYVVFLPQYQYSNKQGIGAKWNKFNTNLWGWSSESNYNLYLYYGKIYQSIENDDITTTGVQYGKNNSIVTPWKTNDGVAEANKEKIVDLSLNNCTWYNADGTYSSFSYNMPNVNSTVSPYIYRSSWNTGWLSKDSEVLKINYSTELGYDAYHNGIANQSGASGPYIYSTIGTCFGNNFRTDNLMDVPAKFAKDVDPKNVKMGFGLVLFKSESTGNARINITAQEKGKIVIYSSDSGEENWDGLKTEVINGTLDPKFSIAAGETKDILIDVQKGSTYWIVGVPDTAETIRVKVNGCTVEREA